jgi:hypothetical protein
MPTVPVCQNDRQAARVKERKKEREREKAVALEAEEECRNILLILPFASHTL